LGQAALTWVIWWEAFKRGDRDKLDNADGLRKHYNEAIDRIVKAPATELIVPSQGTLVTNKVGAFPLAGFNDVLLAGLPNHAGRGKQAFRAHLLTD
jgi:hypothetical protein